MIVSQIKLHETKAGYTVRIEHFGRIATSGKHKTADAAYRDAENKLIIKPGYVQAVSNDGS